MDILNNLWQSLKLVTVMDVIDILLVTFLFYYLFKLVMGTSVQHVLQALLILFVASIVSGWLKLNVINYILSSLFKIGILALIILFQPEIRKMLQQFGSNNSFKFLKTVNDAEANDIKLSVMKVVEAVKDMSHDRVGALIVFQRNDNFSSVTASGTRIDAEISPELISNIFYPKSPLHDGAVIIKNCRVLAAACILPLSDNYNISKELGTRHRAALGMSEKYDSLSVVVSEENSSISFASNGMLKRHLSPETLEKLLLKELLPKTSEEKHTGFLGFLKRRDKQND